MERKRSEQNFSDITLLVMWHNAASCSKRTVSNQKEALRSKAKHSVKQRGQKHTLHNVCLLLLTSKDEPIKI